MMMMVVMAILWSYKKKKSINNDVDNVFGFPASNKGNLLFIQINYLFCAVELCVGGDWRDEQEGFDG